MVKDPIDSADKVLLLTSLNFPVACTVLRKLRSKATAVPSTRRGVKDPINWGECGRTPH